MFGCGISYSISNTILIPYIMTIACEAEKHQRRYPRRDLVIS